MNSALLYGTFWTISLALGVVFTQGEIQRTIMVLALCSVVALALTLIVESGANAARISAGADYRARYGEDPPSGPGPEPAAQSAQRTTLGIKHGSTYHGGRTTAMTIVHRASARLLTPPSALPLTSPHG